MHLESLRLFISVLLDIVNNRGCARHMLNDISDELDIV